MPPMQTQQQSVMPTSNVFEAAVNGLANLLHGHHELLGAETNSILKRLHDLHVAQHNYHDGHGCAGYMQTTIQDILRSCFSNRQQGVRLLPVVRRTLVLFMSMPVSEPLCLFNESETTAILAQGLNLSLADLPVAHDAVSLFRDVLYYIDLVTDERVYLNNVYILLQAQLQEKLYQNLLAVGHVAKINYHRRPAMSLIVLECLKALALAAQKWMVYALRRKRPPSGSNKATSQHHIDEANMKVTNFWTCSLQRISTYLAGTLFMKSSSTITDTMHSDLIGSLGLSVLVTCLRNIQLNEGTSWRGLTQLISAIVDKIPSASQTSLHSSSVIHRMLCGSLLNALFTNSTGLILCCTMEQILEIVEKFVVCSAETCITDHCEQQSHDEAEVMLLLLEQNSIVLLTFLLKAEYDYENNEQHLLLSAAWPSHPHYKLLDKIKHVYSSVTRLVLKQLYTAYQRVASIITASISFECSTVDVAVVSHLAHQLPFCPRFVALLCLLAHQTFSPITALQAAVLFNDGIVLSMIEWRSSLDVALTKSCSKNVDLRKAIVELIVSLDLPLEPEDNDNEHDAINKWRRRPKNRPSIRIENLVFAMELRTQTQASYEEALLSSLDDLAKQIQQLHTEEVLSSYAASQEKPPSTLLILLQFYSTRRIASHSHERVLLTALIYHAFRFESPWLTSPFRYAAGGALRSFVCRGKRVGNYPQPTVRQLMALSASLLDTDQYRYDTALLNGLAVVVRSAESQRAFLPPETVMANYYFTPVCDALIIATFRHDAFRRFTLQWLEHYCHDAENVQVRKLFGQIFHFDGAMRRFVEAVGSSDELSEAVQLKFDVILSALKFMFRRPHPALSKAVCGQNNNLATIATLVAIKTQLAEQLKDAVASQGGEHVSSMTSINFPRLERIVRAVAATLAAGALASTTTSETAAEGADRRINVVLADLTLALLNETMQVGYKNEIDDTEQQKPNCGAIILHSIRCINILLTLTTPGLLESMLKRTVQVDFLLNLLKVILPVDADSMSNCRDFGNNYNGKHELACAAANCLSIMISHISSATSLVSMLYGEPQQSSSITVATVVPTATCVSDTQQQLSTYHTPFFAAAVEAPSQIPLLSSTSTTFCQQPQRSSQKPVAVLQRLPINFDTGWIQQCEQMLTTLGQQLRKSIDDADEQVFFIPATFTAAPLLRLAGEAVDKNNFFGTKQRCLCASMPQISNGFIVKQWDQIIFDCPSSRPSTLWCSMLPQIGRRLQCCSIFMQLFVARQGTKSRKRTTSHAAGFDFSDMITIRPMTLNIKNTEMLLTEVEAEEWSHIAVLYKTLWMFLLRCLNELTTISLEAPNDEKSLHCASLGDFCPLITTTIKILSNFASLMSSIAYENNPNSVFLNKLFDSEDITNLVQLQAAHHLQCKQRAVELKFKPDDGNGGSRHETVTTDTKSHDARSLHIELAMHNVELLLLTASHHLLLLRIWRKSTSRQQCNIHFDKQPVFGDGRGQFPSSISSTDNASVRILTLYGKSIKTGKLFSSLYEKNDDADSIIHPDRYSVIQSLAEVTSCLKLLCRMEEENKSSCTGVAQPPPPPDAGSSNYGEALESLSTLLAPVSVIISEEVKKRIKDPHNENKRQGPIFSIAEVENSHKLPVSSPTFDFHHERQRLCNLYMVLATLFDSSRSGRRDEQNVLSTTVDAENIVMQCDDADLSDKTLTPAIVSQMESQQPHQNKAKRKLTRTLARKKSESASTIKSLSCTNFQIQTQSAATVTLPRRTARRTILSPLSPYSQSDITTRSKSAADFFAPERMVSPQLQLVINSKNNDRRGKSGKDMQSSASKTPPPSPSIMLASSYYSQLTINEQEKKSLLVKEEPVPLKGNGRISGAGRKLQRKRSKRNG